MESHDKATGSGTEKSAHSDFDFLAEASGSINHSQCWQPIVEAIRNYYITTEEPFEVPQLALLSQ